MAWEITPQGYLKTTAKITKGGVLQYYGHEIGLTDSRANKLVDVNRTIEELSKADTLKSIDGMPITITHPDKKSVDATDWKNKTVGHVQNPRADGNYIVCDAYIQDASAIELLKNKDIRELSVGYEPADIQEVNGKFYHKNIKVNHVAIVAEGRAGSDCRLNDSKPKTGATLMKFKAKRKSLVDAIKKLLTDSDLSADEINKKIDELMQQLEEVQGKEDEESKAKADELQKQIDELKAKLEALNDEEPTAGEDDKDARITALTAELEQVKKERDEYKARVEELEAEKDRDSVMNDAKARFPKVKLNDAKSGRDVRIGVLVDHGIYTKDQASKLTDAEIRAAYAGLVATSTKKNKVVSSLLNDSKEAPAKSASKRLGGK
ncbi:MULTISPECIES: DUF2213 domain-containing protein [unclassified Gilliamella]|uniref:DUF2213 domain-containing protein n=1 Tax=unclassified Gilliamella TaxID=2685620 RepID=UPI00080E30EB|nr:DUF2213 domain-containing protein [Gilliamella apicola]OCG33652.1 hypothetical protein A9G32_11460 [Gilliamella apicola]OCG49037.1 hypothetical protein A9G26_09320 [Gilliamella apicola]OCG51785.1 hypothetical protein A9G27_11605 [Gilliamella apicola]